MQIGDVTGPILLHLAICVPVLVLGQSELLLDMVINTKNRHLPFNQKCLPSIKGYAILNIKIFRKRNNPGLWK